VTEREVERAQKGLELAQHMVMLEELEDEARTAAAAYRERIKASRARLAELGREIREGAVQRRLDLEGER
jgi:hypothetical protein